MIKRPSKDKCTCGNIKSIGAKECIKCRRCKTEKVCGRCKKLLPATNYFFYTKKTHWTKSDGTYCEKVTLRDTCKSCHDYKGEQKRKEKRYIELGCDEQTYKKAYLKQYSETRNKYPYLGNKEIPKKEIETIKKKVRLGYIFTTYEQYKLDQKNIYREVLEKRKVRKPDYSDLPKGLVLWKDMPIKEIRKRNNLKMRDSKFANWIGLKLKDAPPELIELRRITYNLSKLIKGK